MTEKLTGKTVFVTAAAQGIGRATALAFARAGAAVRATDINEGLLAGLAGVPGITVGRLDVLDAGAVTAMIEETGPLDVLFNCAGFVHSGTILDMKEEELDFAFDLNVSSMVRTIRAALPGMVAARRRRHHQHVVGGLEHRRACRTASSTAPPRRR